MSSDSAKETSVIAVNTAPEISTTKLDANLTELQNQLNTLKIENDLSEKAYEALVIHVNEEVSKEAARVEGNLMRVALKALDWKVKKMEENITEKVLDPELNSIEDVAENRNKALEIIETAYNSFIKKMEAEEFYLMYSRVEFTYGDPVEDRSQRTPRTVSMGIDESYNQETFIEARKKDLKKFIEDTKRWIEIAQKEGYEGVIPSVFDNCVKEKNRLLTFISNDHPEWHIIPKSALPVAMGHYTKDDEGRDKIPDHIKSYDKPMKNRQSLEDLGIGNIDELLSVNELALHVAGPVENTTYSEQMKNFGTIKQSLQEYKNGVQTGAFTKELTKKS